MLPLIIVIFLAISKKIIISRQRKQKAINELIENEDKKISIVNNISKKVNFPNWYFYLNEFFNIFKNGKELFIVIL